MRDNGQPRPERPQTESDVTMDDLLEQARFESLPPQQQALVYAHHMDQFDAVTAYTGRKNKVSDDNVYSGG